MKYQPNQVVLCVACVVLGVTLDRLFVRINSVVELATPHPPPLQHHASSKGESPSSHNLRNSATSEIDRRRQLLGFDPKTVEFRSPHQQPQQQQQQQTAAFPDVARNANLNNMNNMQWMAEHQQAAASQVIAADSTTSYNTNTRDVHVGTMCRCPSIHFPIPGQMSEMGIDTKIYQQPSKATGPQTKRFIMHPPNSNDNGEGCQCIQPHEFAEPSYDMWLEKLNHNCEYDPRRKFEWDGMPDLGVEERLPLFMGVLSFESPLSLNASLHNWRDFGLFQNVGAQEVFVQMNHMSAMDEQIINTHNAQMQQQNMHPLLTPMGSPQDNIHPGLAISKFCRAAEAHPASHPNGENLLLFVEKDWHTGARMKEEGPLIFRSINALIQRGVHFVRFQPPNVAAKNKEQWSKKSWNCPSQGYPWLCSTSHQHRWANQPSVIDCKWFLRYLEPFALFDDPIMHGCREGMQDAGYIDWECALQDGRVAWTNSQWVVAHLAQKPKIWNHHEVDK